MLGKLLKSNYVLKNPNKILVKICFAFYLIIIFTLKSCFHTFAAVLTKGGIPRAKKLS